jgi:hypothetical protein
MPDRHSTTLKDVIVVLKKFRVEFDVIDLDRRVSSFLGHHSLESVLPWQIKCYHMSEFGRHERFLDNCSEKP